MQYFQTVFLEEAEAFVAELEKKEVRKLFHNIRLAEQTNDPRLFKKLRDDIWEFRTRYLNKQIRLLAFWDKRDNMNTMVVATNGFNKKTDKTPGNEIERAKNIRQKYFNEKT